jgi:hypothetical protein
MLYHTLGNGSRGGPGGGGSGSDRKWRSDNRRGSKEVPMTWTDSRRGMMLIAILACVIVGGRWWLSNQSAPPPAAPYNGAVALPTGPIMHTRPAYDCYASVPNHDAVVGIDGRNCAEVQAALVTSGFQAGASLMPSYDGWVCSVESPSGSWWADVWDSGGQDYGTAACRALEIFAR